MVGVYIGLSFSGFWDYDDTQWYNLTDMIYSQVGEGNSSNSDFIFDIFLCINIWWIFMKCLCFAENITFPLSFNPLYDFFL